MKYHQVWFWISLAMLVIASSLATADEMVLVSPGTFIMGDGVAICGEDEHQVSLTRHFYLGQQEITNQEYLEAVQWAYDQGHVTATVFSVRDNMDGSVKEILDMYNDYCEIQFDGEGSFYLRESPSNFAEFAYPGGYDPADHPVKEVTWYGAARYCDWLSLQEGRPRAYEHLGTWECNGGDPYEARGYRLPTDAEWEFAAQWDDERIYPWGDEAPDCGRANFYDGDYCVGWSSIVGSCPDAPPALALSDMAGNSIEWCNDWHVCDLGTDPVIDPTGPDGGTQRVLRGGTWAHPDYTLRCAYRIYTYPADGSMYVGFRTVRSIPVSDMNGELYRDKSSLFLGANAPNPFMFSTKIRYVIPDRAGGTRVVLSVIDPAGRLVRILTDGSQSTGVHSVAWDGTNHAGVRVAPGLYFYQLQWSGRSETKRLILVR